MSLHIETPRLILRPIQLAEAAVFSAYRSDPEMAKYQSWDAPFSLAQAERFIAEVGATVPGTPGEWMQVGIVGKENGRLLGDCAFGMSSDGKQAEIGFTLARENQGHGFASEAVSHLVDFLFAQFGLHRVFAICDVDNAGSWRLLQRMGWRKEGEFIDSYWFKGGWTSEFHFALLRREWEAKQQHK